MKKILKSIFFFFTSKKQSQPEKETKDPNPDTWGNVSMEEYMLDEDLPSIAPGKETVIV